MMIEQAKEVLRKEAAAIESLVGRIGDEFVKAVELILKCPGRVIVTGMGKSGAIGRKIASTLSTTGTPSLFMHPGEGVHGDVGVVTEDDIALVISYSGETQELLDILPVLRRRGAKIISLTGNKNSNLAKNSDVVLDVSVEEEACPLGLTPTASTTVTLALGDALAVVLLEARGFKEENFAFLHPGGNLGRRLLLRVEDIMRTGEGNPLVSQDTLVKDALFVMTHTRLGATSVVDAAGVLVGVFTDGDLRRWLEKDPGVLNRKIAEVMTRTPITITPGKLATEAGRLIQERQVDNLPVIDENHQPIGMVDIQDLLKAGLV